MPRHPWPAALLRGARVLGVMTLVLGGVGVAAAVGVAWERALEARTQDVVKQRAALPPGEYHDGDPLPAEHPLIARTGAARGALDLRGACVWGRPGRDPYRGTMSEALLAAGLPDAARNELAARAAAGQRSARLTIANDGIREEGGTRLFSAAGFAMTYGRTLCLETRVNFPAGHTEPADLYEAQDERGRRYWVMVPQVCGNVSIITEIDGSLRSERPPGAMPPYLKLRARVGDPPDDTVHQVPEPGSLACVVAALLAWAAVARRSASASRVPHGASRSGSLPPTPSRGA